MPNPRFPELDLLRSLAVFGMIVYHGAYDLVSFYGYDIDILHGGWMILERVVANLFLLLVGISFAISYHRTTPERRRWKFIKRGLFVLACGFVISIVTYIVDPVTYVRFGVLHMIGVSILLLPFFVRLGLWNLLIVCACAILGPVVNHQILPTGLLLPIGFMPQNFVTVDYFPLIPWFGTVLIGLTIGQCFYIRYTQWRSHLPKLITNNEKPITILSVPGRHALLIYMVHQPILIAVLWLIMGPWHV